MSIFRKRLEVIQVCLKCGNKNGQFTCRPGYIYDMSLNYAYVKCFSQTFKNKNTHTDFMLNNIFAENRAVYEIKWKNMVDPGRPRMTI